MTSINGTGRTGNDGAGGAARLELRRVAGCALLACLLGLATTPHAEEGEEKKSEESSDRAVIHFADLGGIRDWRADGSDAILIEGLNGRWYRATFFGPCIGLRFQESIGFVTDPGGSLDRFGSILVDGQRCWFRTFERIPAPDPSAHPDPEERAKADAPPDAGSAADPGTPRYGKP